MHNRCASTCGTWLTSQDAPDIFDVIANSLDQRFHIARADRNPFVVTVVGDAVLHDALNTPEIFSPPSNYNPRIADLPHLPLRAKVNPRLAWSRWFEPGLFLMQILPQMIPNRESCSCAALGLRFGHRLPRPRHDHRPGNSLGHPSVAGSPTQPAHRYP